MIGNLLTNVGKLFEDRNQRVVDMVEQRLVDQLVDLRAQLAAMDPEVMIQIQQRELIEVRIEVIDGLIRDLNSILQRVHAGA